MNIRKIELSEQITAELISLSVLWEQEGSSYGYRRNSLEDFEKEDIFAAEENGCILGYLFCHTYTQKKDICTVPKGSKCLEIEELYVISEKRSQGIGRMLYQQAVSYYGKDIAYVTLGTATKNYQSILHFYIEELGMTFWSARLFKKLDS